MSELLTSRQVAELLGFDCLKTVRRWRDRGWLEGVKLPNRQWRYQRAEVEAIVANGGRPVTRLSERAQDLEAQVMARIDADLFGRRRA